MSNRKEEIADQLAQVEERIVQSAKLANRDRAEINLIVVTKTFPVSDIEILQSLSVNNFGENRDQEAAPKATLITANWHFQGQIQSNKIRSISTWADVIHSISTAKEIARFSQSSRSHQLFLQVSLDGESGRGGVVPEKLAELATLTMESENLELMGLMAVAPLTVTPDLAFSKLALISEKFKVDFPSAKHLSAGMSGDFESAIIHGATHIRIGSSILGYRESR
jgi:pyridoxal phosphate enzyme (YggS family)